MISDPDSIHKLLYQLVKDNPDAFDSRKFRRLPTSIETLTTESPILTALLNMQPAPPPAAAKMHSIIGSLRPSGVDKTTDGVVPYRSAHIEGVVGERVVRSDHGVQKDPEAIREVRDILREHLGLAPVAANIPPAQAARVSAAGRQSGDPGPEAVKRIACAPIASCTRPTKRGHFPISRPARCLRQDPRLLRREPISASRPGTLAQRVVHWLHSFEHRLETAVRPATGPRVFSVLVTRVPVEPMSIRPDKGRSDTSSPC